MKNINRTLAEIMVRKAIKEADESPERASRNLIDLALNFTDGGFMQNFLKSAQSLLKNRESAYFRLLKDTASHTDTEKIVGFGLNLGYNSCTAGLKTIRKTSKEQHFKIPWSLFLKINKKTFADNKEKYEDIIKQCEKLGIRTFILLPSGIAHTVLAWIKKHPDDAFVLYCAPEEITPNFVEEASSVNNLMIAIKYGTGMHSACNFLRKNKMLFSLCYTYTENDIETIESGELFSSAEIYHPVFTMLHAAEGISMSVREKVYNAVSKIREEQKYATVPWSLFFDNCYIDSAFSTEPCIAGFNENGYFFSYNGENTRYDCNFFKHSLSDILKTVFRKDEQ